MKKTYLPVEKKQNSWVVEFQLLTKIHKPSFMIGENGLKRL
jgi:hypothetical protein